MSERPPAPSAPPRRRWSGGLRLLAVLVVAVLGAWCWDDVTFHTGRPFTSTDVVSIATVDDGVAGPVEQKGGGGAGGSVSAPLR